MPTPFLPRRATISNRPHERSRADRTQPRRPVPPDALGTDGIQRPKPKPCRSSPPLGNSVWSLPRGRTRSGRASGPGHRCLVPPNAQSPPRGRPCLGHGHPEPKNQTNSRPVCHPNNVASVPGGGPASGFWQRELTSRPVEHLAVRTVHPGPRAACVSRRQQPRSPGVALPPPPDVEIERPASGCPPLDQFPFESGSPSKYRPAIGQSIDGGVINKSRSHRAYAQQLVTTRLLDCLHDPVTRLSRLQRIHPSALSNCYPAITPPDFYERGVMPC